MNAGKTTTVHHLLHGMGKAGVRPGATKVTGTGSGHDYWVMLDAGAHMMLDFTDAGLAATFQHPISTLERAMAQLVGHLSIGGCGLNLVEIADGVFQQENRRLLVSPLVHDLIDTVILAASDAMGAAQGVRTLTDHGFDVCAVSGVMTKSPLAVREAQAELDLPVLGIPELQDPAVAGPIIGLDMSLVKPVPELELPAWPVSLVSPATGTTPPRRRRPGGAGLRLPRVGRWVPSTPGPSRSTPPGGLRCPTPHTGHHSGTPTGRCSGPCRSDPPRPRSPAPFASHAGPSPSSSPWAWRRQRASSPSACWPCGRCSPCS